MSKLYFQFKEWASLRKFSIWFFFLPSLMANAVDIPATLEERVIFRKKGCVYNDSDEEVEAMGGHISDALKVLERKGASCMPIRKGVEEIRNKLEDFYRKQGRELNEIKDKQMVYREFKVDCYNYDKLLHHEFTEALYYKKRSRPIPSENYFSSVCTEAEGFSMRRLNGEIVYLDGQQEHSQCLKDKLAFRLKRWIDHCEEKGIYRSATIRVKSIQERIEGEKRLTDDVKKLLEDIGKAAGSPECPGLSPHEINKEITKSIVSITSGIADKLVVGTGALIQLGGEIINFAMDRLNAYRIKYSTETQEHLNNVMESNVCMYNEVVKTHCERFKLLGNTKLDNKCLPGEEVTSLMKERNLHQILGDFYRPQSFQALGDDPNDGNDYSSTYSSFLKQILDDYHRPSLLLHPFIEMPKVEVKAEVKAKPAVPERNVFDRLYQSKGGKKSAEDKGTSKLLSEDKEVKEEKEAKETKKDPPLLTPRDLIRIAKDYYLKRDHLSFGQFERADLNFQDAEILVKERDEIREKKEKDKANNEMYAKKLNEIDGKIKIVSENIVKQNIGKMLVQFVQERVANTKGKGVLNSIMADEIARDIYNTYDKILYSFDGVENKLSTLEDIMIENFKGMVKERMSLRYKESFKNFFSQMKGHKKDDPSSRQSLNTSFDSLRSIIKDCIATQGVYFTNRKPSSRVRGLLINFKIIQDPTQHHANLNVKISQDYLKMCWPFLCEEGISLPSLPNKLTKEKDFGKYQCSILDDGFSIYKRMEDKFFQTEKICGRSVDEIKKVITNNLFKKVKPKSNVKDLVEAIVKSPERDLMKANSKNK